MNKTLKNFTLFFISIFAFTSCEIESDLYVSNPESPDDTILASDPVALEATAQGLFRAFYMANTSYRAPGHMFNTMADVSSCSWGNFGMKDMSSEPRAAWNNGTAYGYAYVSERIFNALYSVSTDANLIQKAVAQPAVFAKFDNPQVVDAMSKFAQALTMGYNALYFDKVWLSDENGPSGDPDGATPADAMTFALAKLDAAITAAGSITGAIPTPYFNGSITTGAQLIQVMNGYGARMLANVARTSAQRGATNWSKVKTYAAAGPSADWMINHDDIVWYDLFKTYLVYPGWARIDMRTISFMDSTYDNYWDATKTIYPPATSTDTRLASDYKYLSGQNFRPERGSYHFSSYRYGRYDQYITEWTVPTVEIPVTEMDMYRAEAEAWGGNAAAAAAIINGSSYVTRGGNAAVAAVAADVLAAIHYERIVEMPLASPGLSFFEMRGKDLLQAGTLLHMPIPGSALVSIPKDIYTYGGTQGVAGTDYSTGGWR
jgi:hypothetical protein